MDGVATRHRRRHRRRRGPHRSELPDPGCWFILVAMIAATAPLTVSTAVTSWQWDAYPAVVIAAAGAAYVWGVRRARARGGATSPGRAWCFGVGAGLGLAATMSMIGVYAPVLFWVRALQVLLLLLVVPFFLASAKPVTLLRDALDPPRRDRLDRLLAAPAARIVAHPLTTSIGMLATPWLLYLTPWYTAALENRPVGALTDTWLSLVGVCYFYARLQVDPVPRRYPQFLSILISVVETIGDGLLGIVLWLGPLIAADYYLALQRTWGPSARVDQSIGAGILWILGDVLGLPFLIVLMRSLSSEDRVHAAELDDELDNAEQRSSEAEPKSNLWWETDPQLRDRFRE